MICGNTHIMISIYFIQVLGPHEANVAWDLLRLRETLGASAQALVGLGKFFPQLPNKWANWTLFLEYVTRVRSGLFFF